MHSEKATRRAVLGTLGATGTVALAGCLGDDDAADDTADDAADDTADDTTAADIEETLTIGILQDFSGPLPEYGEQGTTGFYSGLSYKSDEDPLPADAVDEGDYEYAVGDIDVELLVRDTQFDPTQTQELGETLVTDEAVDLLYGVGSSGGATRLITQVVDATETPFIAGPAAAAEITAEAETCREIVFRANENTAMDARSGGVYIAEQTDVENIALFGADDDFGRSVVDNYREVLEARGVTVVEERFVPAGQDEWTGLLDEAEDAGAEAMVGGFTAETLIPFGTAFLQQDRDLQLFGGFASRVTLAPVGGLLADLLDENFTNEGIDEAGFGPFTTRYHWNQYDNEINDTFVDEHTATYGIVPDLFTGGAFTAASAVIQAVQEEGEVSSDAVVSGMRGMTVTDTPKGEDAYTFQEHNNQARSEMTVAPVELSEEDEEDWPAAIQPGEALETIPADEVTIPADETSCEL